MGAADPKESRFKQQNLPAWKPLPTANVVLPIVFITGAACIGIGVALVLASASVKETFFLYGTQCTDQGLTCLIKFTIPTDYDGDVFFYYYLYNYHQNLRTYFGSRNDEQYLGNLQKTSGCAPFDKDGDKPIVPCGAVANSLFNDTYILSWKGIVVPLSSDGLLWDAGQFKNPPDNGGDLCSRFEGTAKPPSWGKPICEMDGGLENVDLNIWMRLAALPNFRKPWRKLNRIQGTAFEKGLPAGDYLLKITNQYPVAQFDGDKGFVVSTTSWAGGKNDFLGIAYLVVGGLVLLIGAILVIVHCKAGHSLAELGDIGEETEDDSVSLPESRQ